MTPARAAWTGAAIGYGATALLTWTMWTDTTPESQLIADVLAVTLSLGTPLAAAAAILAHGLATAARGRDLPERIVGLVSAGVDAAGEEWGAAMRAELATIAERRQRRRFAFGCAVAALRTIDRGAWLTAVAAGTIVAAGTVVASRVSLAGGRGGIMALTLLPTVLVLFGVAMLAAGTARSVRAGLITGGLCLVAAVIAWLGASMAEGAHWYHVSAGVYVVTGDSPLGFPLDLRSAVLDPLGFVIPVVVVWAPWPVLGAAAGALVTRKSRRALTSPSSSTA